jgi:hypothetical protein
MTDISHVFIRRVASGQLVPAELHDGVDDRQIDDWGLLWRPAQQALIEQLRAAGVPRHEWPQTAHWNWAKKLDIVSGLLSHRSLAVVCDRKTQALMRLDVTTKRAALPSQQGLDLVYIDYLEVAPWNWTCLKENLPLYEGVGTLMVNAAVQISIAEGFKGRLGLHSLPQADGFYSRLGMSDLGTSSSSPNLRYFEFASEAATNLINKRSQP